MTAASYGNLPKISIIMVMRNAAGSVGRALESLMVQHYPKLEVIAWDGMSQDDTPQILARYPQLITRVIREQDSGPADAYNRALEFTTGDFIGYLNADDEFEPGMLWAVAEAILHNPQVEIVSTGILYRTVKKDGRRFVSGYYASEEQLEISLENTLSELPTFALSRFLRRELAVRLGPFNTDRSLWYISCDREWTTRLALTPCRHAIVPHALYGFDTHAKGISSNPQSFINIIDEHLMIAAHLLQRTDLTDAQRQIIYQWEKRQLAYGLWKALAQLRIQKLRSFFKQGIALGGWYFLPLAITLLFQRCTKKLGLMLCGGITRG